MKTYRIPEIAQKYVDHDIIQAHTALPDFPDARLRLLYAFLNEQEPHKTHSELYTLVVSLVQLGMDTHDLIDTDLERRTEPEMRSRQLKVLAGDYFSATFYQLLSQAGQIDMISKISGAVSEVNRLKVNLYVRMRQLKMSAEEYLSLTVQLKATLFEIFSGVLEGSLSHAGQRFLTAFAAARPWLMKSSAWKVRLESIRVGPTGICCKRVPKRSVSSLFSACMSLHSFTVWRKNIMCAASSKQS